MTAVTVRVPAKVNLQLSVGPAREDGYHDLVNVFHAVSLFDEVTVTMGADDARETLATVRIASDEPARAEEVPTDGDNLAVRAAELLARETGAGAPVDIGVRKRIPVAGGMAGGSADAAATLVACNTLWGLGFSRKELMEPAARLGSDVPFALLGGTAVGTGRGERLVPALCGGRFHWVFALAEEGLSTGEVYREYDRLHPDAPAPELCEPLMEALASGDAHALGKSLVNDLQPAALNLRPRLRAVLVLGENAGALGTLVSGSGPTCAFLAANESHARDIAATLRAARECERATHAYGQVPGATVMR